MSIRSTRERINLQLYTHKAGVLKNFRILSLVVSVIAVSTLIYFHGFSQTPESKDILLGIIKWSFAFYVFHYLLRIFFDFHPIQFIKKNWFEGILVLMLMVDGISDVFFNTLIIERFFVGLGFETFPHISTVFIQLYLLVVVIIYLFRTTTLLPKIKLHPATLFIISFVSLILIGTSLLLLPEMTNIEGSMSLLDALFTATSAACVTGLTVVDTATYFTFKGQLVILALIKVGGLNIVMFGTFVALASKFGFGVKHHQIIEGFVSKDSLLSSRGMLGKIFIWSLLIELISAGLIYILWDPRIPFANTEQKIFYSIFHSMAAFNNAGFSLFTDNFMNEYVRYNYLVHIVVAVTVFLGAIGFIALFDLFSVASLRKRLELPWKDIEFGTKIALYYSLILIIGGALLILLLESDKSLKEYNFFEATITAFFHSTMTRTAGFNTIDIGLLSVPVLFLMIFLMFIGASSSSTGGGVKTSSVAIMLASVYSTIRGKKNVELFKRTISPNLINDAIAIIIFYCTYIVISLFFLSITEMDTLITHGKNFIDLLFEQISAMSTVGLSTGVTNLLSPAGKVLIILSMFVGRVGALTIVFSVAKSVLSTNYKYPQGDTMVG